MLLTAYRYFNLTSVMVHPGAYNTGLENVPTSVRRLFGSDDVQIMFPMSAGEGYLFTKLPKKKVCDRIIAFIRSHRAEFKAETAKYHVTQYLRVPGV